MSARPTEQSPSLGGDHAGEVDRLSKVYAEATDYYVPFHRGLSSESADKIRKGIAAVLDALAAQPLSGAPDDAGQSQGRVEAIKLPAGVELREFKPCVIRYEEAGLTTYLHEDVACYAKPMTKTHGVDALLAMDDHRLVGVNFWMLLPLPDEEAAALSTHPNDRAQSDIAPPSAAESNTKSPAIASAKGAEDGLVERLRCRTIMVYLGHGDCTDEPDTDCIEAADELTRLRTALAARDKCPIGLDATPDICSAGTCSECIRRLRTTLADRERELDKYRKALEPLRELSARATPGPWEHGKATKTRYVTEGMFELGDACIFPPLGHAGPVAIAAGGEHAKLITESVNTIRFLLNGQVKA